MDKEVVESHQILRLHGGVEDLLSFKEFVPEEVPVLFVSATIAISKKVHLPALLGYQEQQIYRVPIAVKQHQELLVPSIEMAMQLILSDALTEEKAPFYWGREAFGRESIFPNKKK